MTRPRLALTLALATLALSPTAAAAHPRLSMPAARRAIRAHERGPYAPYVGPPHCRRESPTRVACWLHEHVIMVYGASPTPVIVVDTARLHNHHVFVTLDWDEFS